MLDVMFIGVELTRLGVNCFGVEVQGHFLRVVDVAACVARTWHELGAKIYGAELWKLINFNFYHEPSSVLCRPAVLQKPSSILCHPDVL